MSITENTQMQLGEKKYCSGVFANLKKDFDTSQSQYTTKGSSTNPSHLKLQTFWVGVVTFSVKDDHLG